MTTQFTIQDKGFTEMVRKLDSLQQLRALKPSVKAATFFLQGKMRVYPPKTAANRGAPYPHRWYERGWGSAWALKGGGWNRVRKPTSENLQQSWGIKIKNGGLTGVIGTNVSYARYVQDDAKLTSVHKRNGWDKHTVQYIAKEDGPEAIRYISAAIARILAGRGR